MNPTTTCTAESTFVVTDRNALREKQVVRLSLGGTTVVGIIAQMMPLTGRRINIDLIATDTKGVPVDGSHTGIRVKITSAWICEVRQPTAQEDFAQFPKGAVFDLNDDTVERVKVNDASYFNPATGTVDPIAWVNSTSKLKRVAPRSQTIGF